MIFHQLAAHLCRVRAALAPLRSRSLTRLSGVDSRKFVQKLITNDIHALDDPSAASLHAAVLSPQGRILHDVFVLRDSPSSLLLDHCAASAEPFRALLRRYRMRADVSIEPCTDHSVVALFARQPLPALANSFVDTRHEALGRRFVLRGGDNDLARLEAELRSSGVADVWRVDENIYDLYRTCLGVPSDPVEIVSGVSLPSEATLDYLSAISYDKGCYVGQELTARTHFVGTTRKMLMPIVPASAAGDGLVAEPGSLFEKWSRDVFGPAFGVPLPPIGVELEPLSADGGGGGGGGGRRGAGKVMRGGVWGAGFALMRLENLPADLGSAVFACKKRDGDADDDEYAAQVKLIEPHWWATHVGKRFTQ